MAIKKYPKYVWLCNTHTKFPMTHLGKGVYSHPYEDWSVQGVWFEDGLRVIKTDRDTVRYVVGLELKPCTKAEFDTAVEEEGV